MTIISNRAKNINESATLKSAQKARALKESGRDIISLTLGEPDFATPKHIKKAAIESIQNATSDHYTTATGISALKEAILNFHYRKDKLSYKIDEIVVGTGAKHLLYVLFQSILNDGDKVIIPTPYWVSYSEQVKLAGGECVFVKATQENAYKITVEQLEQLPQQTYKAIILNSPNNPTGSVYSKEELRLIGNWAVKNKILIIADEIYYQLVYGEMNSFSIASLSNDIQNNTIIINGVSKSYAMTGWRVGYAMSKIKEIIFAMGQIISHETSNLTAVSQYAAIAAYQENQQSVIAMKDIFEERLNLFYNLICQIDGFEVEKPKGAFYLFPNVKKAMALTHFKHIDDFCDALLEKAGVAVVSGSAFGEEDCLRMSYAGDSNLLVEAANRIAKFMKEYSK